MPHRINLNGSAILHSGENAAEETTKNSDTAHSCETAQLAGTLTNLNIR